MEKPVQTAEHSAEDRISRALKLAAKSLILGDLNIHEVPESIGDVVSLEHLDLESIQLEHHGSNLSTLTSAIGRLAKLRSIEASGNRITWLPTSLGQLGSLEALDVSCNLLTSLPQIIGALTHLRYLDVAFNELTELPESIGELTGLETLDLTENFLYALPDSLRKLRSLKALFLHGNDDLGIPVELLGPTADAVEHHQAQPADPARILDYYFHTQTA